MRTEDPAVAMEGVDPRRKLGRVLWFARVADAVSPPDLRKLFHLEMLARDRSRFVSRK